MDYLRKVSKLAQDTPTQETTCALMISIVVSQFSRRLRRLIVSKGAVGLGDSPDRGSGEVVPFVHLRVSNGSQELLEAPYVDLIV